MARQLINPRELYDGSAFGMSQGVVAPPGQLLFVSGQVAWDHQHSVTADTLDGQFQDALAKLAIVLRAAGTTIEDLVHVRIYVRGELAEHMAVLGPILSVFLGTSRPAVTGIGGVSLASLDTLVEVEAVAHVGAPADAR